MASPINMQNDLTLLQGVRTGRLTESLPLGDQLELVVWREYIVLAGLLLFSQKCKTVHQVIAELAAKKQGTLELKTGNNSSASAEVSILDLIASVRQARLSVEYGLSMSPFFP